MSVNFGSYDYIVVGAGTAGCVVAARLSESGRHSVLLLEAGPADTNVWIRVPLGYANVFSNPALNWMYESDIEPALYDRTMYQPRGKVLGGTSSINGMIHIRGNRADFDGWLASGCAGWGWEDVLPYFKKSEDFYGGESELHGAGGPLKVTENPTKHAIAEAVLEAAQAVGLPFNADFNGVSQDGVGYYQYNIYNGKRWSASTAYLKPARKRTNLRIETNVHVTRVMLADGRATGVEFLKDGALHHANARGEVVVSSGVYGSPQLLQLSGIGSPHNLKALGISPTVDLPAVGQNLQDHFYTQLMFRCTKAITINDFARSWPRKAIEAARFMLTGTGVLASTHLYVGGFVRSSAGQPKPDIQFNMTAWSVAERTAKGAKPHPFPGFSLSPIHLDPDARGEVQIRSNDPKAPPRIRFNFLQTQHDINAMLFGIRLVRKLAAQEPLAPFIAEEIQPGPNITSDEEVIEFLRRKAVSNLHPVGTCRMGSQVIGTVVDPTLKVRSVSNLRVVDGSIMPRIVTGNSNAATVMIAEKAADMILSSVKEKTSA